MQNYKKHGKNRNNARKIPFILQKFRFMGKLKGKNTFILQNCKINGLHSKWIHLKMQSCKKIGKAEQIEVRTPFFLQKMQRKGF